MNTFVPRFFSRSVLIWKKTRDKSVQLVRGSFLSKFFLQNPYFNEVCTLQTFRLDMRNILVIVSIRQGATFFISSNLIQQDFVWSYFPYCYNCGKKEAYGLWKCLWFPLRLEILFLTAKVPEFRIRDHFFKMQKNVICGAANISHAIWVKLLWFLNKSQYSI